jgi:hypothetical protein
MVNRGAMLSDRKRRQVGFSGDSSVVRTLRLTSRPRERQDLCDGLDLSTERSISPDR